MPRTSTGLAGTMITGGAIATVAFDLFGQALSPMAGFASLAPVPLATQVWGQVFGAPWTPGGHLLHYVAGLIGYPLGWMLIARPLAARLVPGLHWLAVAAAYGVGLWIFAMYFMATLVAGQPAFLGFTGITWVALVGHVLFAVVFAAVERRMARHQP
jgi:hypothetical protein